MKVNLRIERLVLDGVELTRRERAALAGAIERELRLQLAPPARARPQLAATIPDGRAGARVERIGRDIAAALHSSLPKGGAA
jgi:hypothetical protein